MRKTFARQFAIAMTVALAIVTIPAAGPAAALGGPPQGSGVQILVPVGADIGPSLAHANASDHRGEAKREMTLLSTTGKGKPGGGGSTPDGALQTTAATALGATAGVSFDGVGVGLGAYVDCCAPPDTNASVGLTEIVQWVNLDYAVWDKATGALLSGPIKGSQLFAGFTAGNCDKNNDGDPIVKFDAQAQRWFVTQFSVTGGPPYFECIAVSSGPSFLQSTTWARYAYSFGSYFPDYPKAAVWPDAYYMAYNRFFNGSTFSGAAACAYDRAKMVAGDLTATGQCFNTSTSYGGLLPSDLDGATAASGSTALPPVGAPNVFLNLGSGALNAWQFHIDFTTAGNSRFTGPVATSTAAFSKACGGGTCIAQAGTSNQLDSLADRLMYRLAYRNFGGYSSLVVTHSVSGSGTAAPRWYELRSATAGATAPNDYTLYQQGSYAPTTEYRWMSSAAQDKTGNLAIGYSVSSSTQSPGIRYTGRASSDPLGQLRIEATVSLPSTGSQTGSLHRWGDYSSMAVDPSDDCTFWYTTEYLKTSGSFNWSTRIISFKMPGCL